MIMIREEGCDKQPTQIKQKRTYCGQPKLEGMINVITPLRVEEGSDKRSMFNYADQTK